MRRRLELARRFESCKASENPPVLTLRLMLDKQRIAMDLESSTALSFKAEVRAFPCDVARDALRQARME